MGIIWENMFNRTSSLKIDFMRLQNKYPKLRIRNITKY